MSDETVPTPDKMKVTELRKALNDRGLNPKGTKAVLVKQLFAAMHAEEGPTEEKIDEQEEKEVVETEELNEKDDDAEDTRTNEKVKEKKAKEIEKKNAEEKEEEEKKKKEADEEKKKLEEEKKEADKLAEEKVAEKLAEEKKEEERANKKKKEEEENVAEEKKKEEERVAEEKKKKEDEKAAQEKKKEEEERVAEEKKKEEEEKKKKEDEKAAQENKKKEEERVAEETKKKEEETISTMKKEETEKTKDADDMTVDKVEPEKSKNSAMDETKQEIKEDIKCGVKYTKVLRTVYVRQKDEENEEEMKEVIEAKRGGTKRKMGEEENQEPNGKKRKVEKEETEEDKIEKKEPPFEVKQDEPEIDENLMSLDWYNSDLNLKIGEDKISGQPENKNGWGYAYAGARSTYGFNSGKVWYEVKFTEALDCSLEKEGNRHDLRVGWSTDDASLQLGEDQHSWCYAGATGKMANNRTFEEYGENIEQGDIVGAYLDFEGDNVSVSFTRNGDDLGDAFQITKTNLEGRYLFPHILSKNVKFEVNFGGMEAWKEPLPGGYIQAAKSDHKVRGKPRIQKREDCELIMMVGLPASGKTTWVNKFLKENPYKNYNILGTSALLNKMTIEGKARKEIHEGKWADILRVVTSCNQDMIELASKRRRNFIIDQPNVYANAQKKKVEPFVGFKRRAVVVVTTAKQHNQRIQEQEEKNFPYGVIEELRANLTLPKEEDTWFTEITFAELQREEAEKVVEQDKKVAKEKGYGKNKDRKLKKNPGKGAARVQTNARSKTAQRGQGNRRGGQRTGGQVKRPQNFRGQQNNGGSPMWNNYWQDKHHNNLRNMAQAGGPGGPNPHFRGNMGGPNAHFRGNMGMSGGNMGARQGMMGGQANMGGQRNMGPQWGNGIFNQGGNQPNPFSQNWSQGGGWRR